MISLKINRSEALISQAFISTLLVTCKNQNILAVPDLEQETYKKSIKNRNDLLQESRRKQKHTVLRLTIRWWKSRSSVVQQQIGAWVLWYHLKNTNTQTSQLEQFIRYKPVTYIRNLSTYTLTLKCLHKPQEVSTEYLLDLHRETLKWEKP